RRGGATGARVRGRHRGRARVPARAPGGVQGAGADRRGRRAAPQRDGQGRADRPAGAALTPVLCTGSEGAPSFPVHRTGGWEGCGGQTERRVPPSTSRVAPLTHSAAALARNTTAAATSPGSPNR